MHDHCNPFPLYWKHFNWTKTHLVLHTVPSQVIRRLPIYPFYAFVCFIQNVDVRARVLERHVDENKRKYKKNNCCSVRSRMYPFFIDNWICFGRYIPLYAFYRFSASVDKVYIVSYNQELYACICAWFLHIS